MAIENYLTYNNVRSDTYNVYVSGAKTFRTAERDYETIEIPGRNGYLLQDNNRYKPVIVEYDAFCVNNALANYRDLVNALAKNFGLYSLTDTFDTTHFRMGVFAGGVDPNIYALQTARFTLKFHCQPERCLISGWNNMETYTADGTITNPTGYPTKPLIRIFGNGTVGIGNISITVTGNSNPAYYVDIDCETGYAFMGNTNRSGDVTMTDHNMPTLGSGSTAITVGTGIQQLKILPRWWEL